MEKLFVAGHGITEQGSIFLVVKDKIAKSAMFSSLAKANKTGSIFLAKGVTMEEAKEQFPLGRDLSSILEWGEERQAANSNGEALRNVYEVVERETALEVAPELDEQEEEEIPTPAPIKKAPKKAA